MVAVPQPSYRHFAATVVANQDLSPTFRRITVGGPDLEHFGTACLDQRAKLVLPLPGEVPFRHLPTGADWYREWRSLPGTQQNPFRTITVRAVRPEAREVDIDIALHGDLGPLSRWAQECGAGSRVVVIGPDQRVPEAAEVGLEWKPGNAHQVLLAGDETAVPAIVSILEQAPLELVGDAWLEVPLAADCLDLRHPPGVRVHWVPREGRRHGEPLIEAVTDAPATTVPAAGPQEGEEPLWEVREGNRERFAWIAGEASTVRTLRRHLVSNGWAKEHVAFMGYWRKGHAEA